MPIHKTAKTSTMLLKFNAILIKHCVTKMAKTFINLTGGVSPYNAPPDNKSTRIYIKRRHIVDL